jgi:alkylation response protein AidB-like acyl-CoA dehydrogenase
MTHSLIRMSDIDFLLFDWLKVEELFDKPKFAEHNRETVCAILSLSEKLAEDFFLPLYKETDIIEPRLGTDGVEILPSIGVALRKYAELGFFSASFPVEQNGFGLPATVSAAIFSFFSSASTATAAFTMLTTANARLIAEFGTQDQIETFAYPQIEGRWFGTMCLSEPQAGSDLGAARTCAVCIGQDDLGDRYKLVGNKMWISGGDQNVSENIVHLVLAKVADADGKLPENSGGLSLFIVPKLLPDGTRNDVSVAGLNHKMGYRGISNCLLNFGENTGAIGWLVGQEGDGLRQMFTMMNEARISVGLGATALGYRGYRLAVSYAKERLQGRGPDAGVSVPIIHHADVRSMLLAQKSYVEGALALCLFGASLIDKEDEGDNADLLALLTPVIKSFPSEFALKANDLAIQVHGGYGYTRDFDVEQLYRDNRLNPIHEGTTGIQAIDLVGRKVLRDKRGLSALRSRVDQTIERAMRTSEFATNAEILSNYWVEIDQAIAHLKTLPNEAALNNATPFLFAFGHSVVGWLWLDQAILASELKNSCGGEMKAVTMGKLAACKFFFAHELPHVTAWLSPVFDDSQTLAVAEEFF